MPAVPSSLLLTLKGEKLDARTARRAVMQVVGDNGSIQFVRDAILLTSELVSNAVIHTEQGCAVTVAFDRSEQRLRVEVADSSEELPTMASRSDRGRIGGLGLVLVEDVATRWGTTPTATGKTTWFELDA